MSTKLIVSVKILFWVNFSSEQYIKNILKLLSMNLLKNLSVKYTVTQNQNIKIDSTSTVMDGRGHKTNWKG